jgi:hypothetical protein
MDDVEEAIYSVTRHMVDLSPDERRALAKRYAEEHRFDEAWDEARKEDVAWQWRAQEKRRRAAEASLKCCAYVSRLVYYIDRQGWNIGLGDCNELEVSFCPFCGAKLPELP